MRSIFLLLVTTSLLLAFTEHIETFSADFEQRITDDQNKTLTYQGHVWSKRPDKALWHYQKPVEKKVYVHGKNVVIIEPDLEQAMLRYIEKDIDLLAILKSAKPLGNGLYEARFESQRFLITVQNGVLEKIDYIDMFDNKVELKFSGQAQNHEIDNTTFKAMIPPTYDIIK